MRRIGMLTPSSNTVLEPVSTTLLQGVGDLTLHFSRFRVTRIGLDSGALKQFDPSPMITASELLADAKVDCITWNGTSSSWLGFDTDRQLVQEIERHTGIKASTCVLTLQDVLRRHGLGRIGLVSPYTRDVQERIAATFAAEGLDVVAERHLGMCDNHAFGLVDETALSRMVAEVVSGARPDAVVILCTNLAAAPHVPRWERDHGVPVLDSVAVSLYGAMRAVGRNPASLGPLGKLFSL